VSAEELVNWYIEQAESPNSRSDSSAASKRLRHASDISRFKDGRDSLHPDTPWSVNSSTICQPRRPAYSRSSASCISGSWLWIVLTRA
jgi:hypothetical protein